MLPEYLTRLTYADPHQENGRHSILAVIHLRAFSFQTFSILENPHNKWANNNEKSERGIQPKHLVFLRRVPPKEYIIVSELLFENHYPPKQP